MASPGSYRITRTGVGQTLGLSPAGVGDTVTVKPQFTDGKRHVMALGNLKLVSESKLDAAIERGDLERS